MTGRARKDRGLVQGESASSFFEAIWSMYTKLTKFKSDEPLNH
jgi:hypothetical protein